MTDSGGSRDPVRARLPEAEPLLISVSPSEGTDLTTFATRRSRSFWVFVMLSIGVLGFLVYSTMLIIYDALAGNYGWYDIEKPNNDPKIYKFLPELLPNAPPIVVVQDPGAQLTGFAIGVSAGAYYDPMDFPGLAHFTEHMLFLGTEKYPGPTSFDEFISSHGGSSNAFTDSERTVYYNAIDSDSFPEGFSRFLEFFTRPLFNATYIAKEVNAVDSEHDMHINDPHWRMFSLVNSVSLPPGNHYSTGDSSTLMAQGVSALEAAMRAYFASNYCFNRLSIAIVSPLPVSDQVEIVRDVFSGILPPIPQNCRPATNFTRMSPQLTESGGFPIPLANRQKIIYSQGPEGTVPTVWIVFPYRSVVSRGEGGKHPFGILEMVLTYNGQGSLKQTLIASGLITSMAFMYDDTSAGALAYIAYDVSASARDRMDELISTTFSFLDIMRINGGISEQFANSVKEARDSLFYSNAEPSSIVNETPMRLSKYFAAQLTVATKNRHVGTNGTDLIGVNEKIMIVDSPLVNDVLGHLTVANSVIVVHDPTYSKSSPPDWIKDAMDNVTSAAELTSEHYGFNYTVGVYSDAAVAAWTTSDLATNITVFTNMTVFPPLTVKDTSLSAPRTNATLVMTPPTKVYSIPGVEVWFKPSALARTLSKVWLWSSIRPAGSAVSSLSPEELQFNGEMIVDCVTFELRSKVADFVLAGYDFDINWAMSGYYTVSVSGWDDRVDELMQIVVSELSSPTLNFFDLILAEKIDADSRARPLSEVAGEALNSLVVGSPTRDDVQTYLNTYPPTKEGLIAWSQQVFNSTYFTLYVAGSDSAVNQTRAVRIGQDYVESFAKAALVDSPAKAVYFLAGPHFVNPVEVRMVSPSPNDPNSALLYSLTYGSDMSSSDRVLAALLSNILDPLVFRNIRTEHQMGYIASAKVGIYPAPAGAVQIRVYIQGNVADPDMMEARFEALLGTIPSVLEGIAIGEIQQRAEGLATGLEEVPTSAYAEVAQFWQPIHEESGCFSRLASQAAFLRATDPATLKAGLVRLFTAFWATRRSKVVVKVWNSENSNGPVPAWTNSSIGQQISDPALLISMNTEKAATTFLNGISRRDRENAFDNAVDPVDPLWEPTIPRCEVWSGR